MHPFNRYTLPSCITLLSAIFILTSGDAEYTKRHILLALIAAIAYVAAAIIFFNIFDKLKTTKQKAIVATITMIAMISLSTLASIFVHAPKFESKLITLVLINGPLIGIGLQLTLKQTKPPANQSLE